jgi:LmbE family N-acetylglucosaminyl deacetylase
MSSELAAIPKRVLAVAAHPDDIDFMAGGSIARWTAAGAQVTYCVITDGTAGSRDPNMTHQRLAALREQEQRAAATAVGAQEVIFLGYRDGRLEASLALRVDIARVIRRVRPDTLLCGDPTMRWSSDFGYINHPDHIAAADATLAAIMPTANTLLAAPELLDEGLAPHDVETVLLSSFGNGTIWVPLTERELLAKVAGLREHHSQLDGWDIEPRMREWLTRSGEHARAAGVDCQYAEGFVRIVLRQPQPEEGAKAADQTVETTTA